MRRLQAQATIQLCGRVLFWCHRIDRPALRSPGKWRGAPRCYRPRTWAYASGADVVRIRETPRFPDEQSALDAVYDWLIRDSEHEVSLKRRSYRCDAWAWRAPDAPESATGSDTLGHVSASRDVNPQLKAWGLGNLPPTFAGAREGTPWGLSGEWPSSAPQGHRH